MQIKGIPFNSSITENSLHLGPLRASLVVFFKTVFFFYFVLDSHLSTLEWLRPPTPFAINLNCQKEKVTCSSSSILWLEQICSKMLKKLCRGGYTHFLYTWWKWFPKKLNIQKKNVGSKILDLEPWSILSTYLISSDLQCNSSWSNW